jgi:hypothetical protein
MNHKVPRNAKAKVATHYYLSILHIAKYVGIQKYLSSQNSNTQGNIPEVLTHTKESYKILLVLIAHAMPPLPTYILH